MKTKDNTPYKLFVKFFKGEISKKEQKELDNFILENPKNEKIFKEYKLIWETESETDKFLDKTEFALEKVKKEILSKEKSINSNNFKIIFRIAAAVIIVFGLSYIALNTFSDKELIYVSIESNDQILKKELEDGSIIWLNKNSKLEYPEEFDNDSRKVKFIGEAYFIIKHDPEKPFIIESEYTKTEVLGTEFNLKANNKENEIELVLVKGKVKFTDSKTNKAKTLLKNEKVILNKENRSIDKSKVESVNFLSWKTKEINLDNLSLEQIAKDLNKNFGTEIIIENQIKDIVYHQTLPFTNPNLKDILNTIKFSLNLTIDSIDDKIVIKKEN